MVLAVLRTVYLKTVASLDITNAANQMVQKNAYSGGLVTSAKHTVFLTTMMTTAITAVRLTEIKHATMDGTERTARCFVFLKMMTYGAITLAMSMAAKSVLMGIDLQTVWTAS